MRKAAMNLFALANGQRKYESSIKKKVQSYAMNVVVLFLPNPLSIVQNADGRGKQDRQKNSDWANK